VAGPGQNLIGWNDYSGTIYLNPGEVYSMVYNHCQRTGEYFGIHRDETWQDMKSLEYLSGIEEDDTPTYTKSIEGIKLRVLPLKRSVLYPEEGA
jgi:hypothetical protein